MNFSPVLRNNVQIGKEWHGYGVFAFFGNRHATLEVLKEVFPAYTFNFAKQVHGDALIKSPGAGEADAIWTDRKHNAVGVYTADCLPVLISLPERKSVVAIHAGWRGVANQIIRKTLNELKPSGESRAFIGPHIGRESFEVGQDVASILESVGPKGVSYKHANAEKKYIDLSAIATHQLTSSGLDAKRLLIDHDNTYTKSEYVSYRRDGAGCGRLISFIALT